MAVVKCDAELRRRKLEKVLEVGYTEGAKRMGRMEGILELRYF